MSRQVVGEVCSLLKISLWQEQELACLCSFSILVKVQIAVAPHKKLHMVSTRRKRVKACKAGHSLPESVHYVFFLHKQRYKGKKEEGSLSQRDTDYHLE